MASEGRGEANESSERGVDAKMYTTNIYESIMELREN